MYFTDKNNQRVRRVNKATSTVETIAGTGLAGYNGDSISSTAAQLNFPSALAIDSQGAVYVGDNSNYRIRKLNAGGYITTFAGSGTQGTPQPGDTLASTTLSPIDSLATKNSTLYFTDTATSAVWQIINTLQPLSAISTPAYLCDAAPISTAYFNNPTGLAIDNSGDLLICDTGNYRLRKTYTFGYPLNPLYVNMSFNYTNYFVSTGTATISLNGNPLTTFYASEMADSTFSITDTNILNYPLQGSNPVYGNQQPYIQITQQGANGYTKLDGTMFVNQVPGQGLLRNAVDSESGIIMNSGTLVFPNQNNGITIENSYNDASLRTINYTGSLVNASDPALKENIVGASLPLCYITLASLPLRRYNYVAPYMSTFHTTDNNRLGFLTSEVRPFFPNSLRATPMEHAWAPSTIKMLDIAQIKYTHYGVTQQLIATVSTLEAETKALSKIREELRAKVAQRNSIH
jgi:sugar lactone lactonase YvrE